MRHKAISIDFLLFLLALLLGVAIADQPPLVGPKPTDGLIKEQREAIEFLVSEGEPVDICYAISEYSGYFLSHKLNGTAFESAAARLDYLGSMTATTQARVQDTKQFLSLMKVIGKKVYESEFISKQNLPFVSYVMCEDLKKQLTGERRSHGKR